MIKNIGSNWILLVANIAIAYYLTPFTLQTLGRDQYGVWLLMTAITGYLGLLVLGLPMTTVRFVAKHADDEDPTELNRAVANCLGISSLLAGVALLAGGIAFVFFSSYHIPAALWPPARIAFFIIVLNTACGFVGQLPLGILAAHEQFVAQNKILIGSLLLRFAFTVTLLRLHPTFVVLALALALSVVVEATAGALVVRARYPHIKPQFSEINWTTTRAIFGFSVYVLMLGIGGQLSFQTDAIVIGKVIGVHQIPFFTTASLLALYLMQLAIGIGAVVMPNAARLHAAHGVEGLHDLLLKWSKICFSLTLFASLFLIILGPQLLGWWLGPEFVGPGGTVLRILMIGNLVYLQARGVAQPILMGTGNPRQPAFAFVAAGAANLVLSIALGYYYGIAGVAVGTAVPNALFAIYLSYSVCRTIDIRVSTFVRYVFLQPTLGALPVLAVVYGCARVFPVTRFSGLFASGLVMAAAFAVVWIGYVYRGDRFIDLPVLLRAQVRRA